MKLNKQELSSLYQEQRPAAVGREGCVSTEVLALGASGELSLPARARIADHLAVCSECAAEYRVACSLRTWSEDAAHELPPKERREGWFFPIWRTIPVLSAVAAALLIATVLLGAWVLSLRQEARSRLLALQHTERQRALAEIHPDGQDASQVAALRQQVAELSLPQINVPIIDLDPRNATRGPASQDSQTLSVPSAANVFTLILNVAGRPSFANYSLEIVDSKNAVIWAGSGLQKSSSNAFTLAIPRKLLPAGWYRIKLYGLRRERKELIEDYRVTIQYP